MKITVLGAGNVGGALARGIAQAGHSVVVTATELADARSVATEVGGIATTDLAQAARDSEVIVLAMPYDALGDVARQLGDAASGKVVIDATHPLTADMSGMVVTDRAGAEHAQAQLPGARVVKAFNTVFAANQSDALVDGTVLDGFYAGDDEGAKAVVKDLLVAIGFRPVDVGGLARSLALEHMAFVNINLNAANGWSFRSGWKLVGPLG